jgi:predicted histidine transporter YuiF (NhaC family)
MTFSISTSVIAILPALVTQLITGETILGALDGFCFLALRRCLGRESGRAVVDGLITMAAIACTLLGAASFGKVMCTSTDISALIQ